MFKLHEIRQLILWKIIKIVATRCQILRLKCTKFDFGSLQRSPAPIAGFKGPTSKGMGGEGRGVERREEKGRGEGRKGKGRKGPHQLGGPRAPNTLRRL